MSTITSLGVGSGIDIRGLVDSLVNAQREPAEKRIDLRQENLEATLSGLGRIKSALSEFGKAVAGTADSTDFIQRQGRVLDDSIIDAAVGRTTPTGNYEIEVLELARTQRLVTRSDIFADVPGFQADRTSLGAGEVTLVLGQSNAQGNPLTETFTLTSSASSLNDLRDIINRESQSMRAAIIDDGSGGARLMLTARNTGAQQGITAIQVNQTAGGTLLDRLTFDVNNLDPQNTNGGFSQLRAGSDARALIDDLLVTRATNTLDDVIQGVRITLRNEGVTRISVTDDTSPASTAVNGFVEAYNKLFETLNELGFFNPGSGEAGPLNGDATLRSLQFTLSNTLSSTFGSADSPFRSLRDLGIAIGGGGQLDFNPLELESALSKNTNAVMQLFTDAQSGVAKRMNDIIQDFTSSRGPIEQRTRGLNDDLKRLSDQRLDLDQRMQQVEATLLTQFIAMDQLVAQMNQTSDFIAAQLEMLAANQQQIARNRRR